MQKEKKKKILFICSNMGIGGFQKSLVSLLRCFDYGRYEVDLLLMKPEGIFMELIPEQVNVISIPISSIYFEQAQIAIPALLKERLYKLAGKRLLSAILARFDRGIGAKYLSKAIPKLEKRYDVAIDYNGQYLLYYMVDGVNAGKKISYFHNDYKKWPFYKRTDQQYYRHVDTIVTVSDQCVQSMKDIFPQYSEKIYCIENINSINTVNIFPENSNSFTDGFDGVRLVTVGRVCMDKGIDMAIKCCQMLKGKGVHFRWYWVGPGNSIQQYNEELRNLHIENEFVFLGGTNNPYDYMRNADLIVHPARIEGKSVAIEEAKVLGKPVVATNFSTVRNQLEDGKTGLIVEMEPEKIADGIQRLLEDRTLYRAIEHNLQAFRDGNEAETEKLYRLIEGN